MVAGVLYLDSGLCFLMKVSGWVELKVDGLYTERKESAIHRTRQEYSSCIDLLVCLLCKQSNLVIVSIDMIHLSRDHHVILEEKSRLIPYLVCSCEDDA